MQRMKLHTSGIKLSKVGSLQDRVIRSYMVKEAQLEAKRTEFTMLLAMTTPSIQQDKRQDWVKSIQENWKKYLSDLFYVEIPETTPEEEMLKEYYDRVVSKLKPSIKKDRKTGKLEVSGLDQMKF